MAVATLKNDGVYPAYIVDGDMEVAVVGDWIRVPPGAEGIGFVFNWDATDTPTGTFAVEATNKADASADEIVTIDIVPQPVAAGVAGKDDIDIMFLGKSLYRLRYDPSADGVGALLNASAKVVL